MPLPRRRLVLQQADEQRLERHRRPSGVARQADHRFLQRATMALPHLRGQRVLHSWIHLRSWAQSKARQQYGPQEPGQQGGHHLPGPKSPRRVLEALGRDRSRSCEHRRVEDRRRHAGRRRAEDERSRCHMRATLAVGLRDFLRVDREQRWLGRSGRGRRGTSAARPRPWRRGRRRRDDGLVLLALLAALLATTLARVARHGRRGSSRSGVGAGGVGTPLERTVPLVDVAAGARARRAAPVGVGCEQRTVVARQAGAPAEEYRGAHRTTALSTARLDAPGPGLRQPVLGRFDYVGGENPPFLGHRLSSPTDHVRLVETVGEDAPPSQGHVDALRTAATALTWNVAAQQQVDAPPQAIAASGRDANRLEAAAGKLEQALAAHQVPLEVLSEVRTIRASVARPEPSLARAEPATSSVGSDGAAATDQQRDYIVVSDSDADDEPGSHGNPYVVDDDDDKTIIVPPEFAQTVRAAIVDTGTTTRCHSMARPSLPPSRAASMAPAGLHRVTFIDPKHPTTADDDAAGAAALSAPSLQDFRMARVH